MTTEPRRAWHGTRRRFDAFDPARSESEYGTFFSDSPQAAVLYADGEGGRIVEVRLTFADPYVCGVREWHDGVCRDPKDVADEDVHDGMVVDGLDGTTFVAWKPETIEIVGDAFMHGTPAFDELKVLAVEAGYMDDENADPVP